MRVGRVCLIAVVGIAALAVPGNPVRAQGDERTCFGEAATIVGSDDDDALEGTDEADVITAGGGNDTVMGGDGADLICGGTGADRLYGQAGADGLTGEFGRARLVGGPGGDRLVDPRGEFGSAFVVRMYGGLGDDHLEGGYPANIMVPGAGDDHVEGGGTELFNALLFNRSDRAIEADASDGIATGEGRDRFSGVHSIIGSRFDDVLVGGESVDSLAGFDGDDHLVSGGEGATPTSEPDDVYLAGGPGDDVLVGAESDDRISGEMGDDVVHGRDGDDWIVGWSGVPNNRSDSDVIRGGAGSDHVEYDLNGRARFAVRIDLMHGVVVDKDEVLFEDAIAGIERASGTNNDDVFIGDGGDNHFWGLEGNDRAYGAAGNDLLEGYADADRLDGGAGVDELVGGLGPEIDFCIHGEIVSECEETRPWSRSADRVGK